MNTSEAYQKLVLSNGLADAFPYDDFQVWWASSGITMFYKNKIETEDRIRKHYRGLTGEDISRITDLLENQERLLKDELQAVFEAINNAIPQITVSPEQIGQLIRWFYNSPLTSGRPLATPPGGDWIGVLIGLFIGGNIARFSRAYSRANRNRRDPSEYNRYRFYQSWREEYVSDRYESWEHYDYQAAYDLYLLLLSAGMEGGTITWYGEEIDWNTVLLAVFGAGGAGGGGGGRRML